jgi:hypothetical protein
MPGNNQFKAHQFIKAIPGTAGIVSAIARKVGCDWHTAKKYIDAYPTIKQAYDDEVESNLDLAESVVMGNIKLAAEEQEAGERADTSDAKWYLSKKGKHRGFTDRQEIDITSGGEPIIQKVKGFDDV